MNYHPDMARNSEIRSVAAGVRAMLIRGAVFASLAGCGSRSQTPTPAQPAIAEKAAVIVTFDGNQHACVVALSSEAQGSAIPCSDVFPFVKDELRLASGSAYDIRTIPDVDEAEMARVEAKLNEAGYRLVGGAHAMFITAPKRALDVIRSFGRLKAADVRSDRTEKVATRWK